MWQDTIRFVRCVKNTVELPLPVHEFGANASGTPLVPPEVREKSKFEPESKAVEGGPRVQPIEDMASLPFRDNCAGTVACLNILQHVTDPGAVAGEMIRLLKPGGILLVCSCTAGRTAANPDLLWRPAPHAFQKLLASLEATLVGWQGREGDPHSIYALGCKAPVNADYVAGANRFLRSFRKALAREQRAVPWLEKAREWLARLSGRVTSGRARSDYYRTQFVMHTPVDGQFQHEVLANCLELSQSGSRLDLMH